MGGQVSKVEEPTVIPDKQQKMNQYMDEVDEHHKESPIHLTSKASEADPTKLRRAYMKQHQNESMDEVDSAALKVNPLEWEFPFENVVLEGGGNKGLAYAGVFKCLEDVGVRHKIKRVGGASAGALTAAMLALGFSADECFTIMSQDLEEIFVDHSCGYFSLIPNILRTYGWNPGTKVLEWFGKLIGDKTGNPNYTFYDLYKHKGVELMIVVTNVNMLTVQYCHPKTTPDMPIKDALRMTMAIPGVYAPMEYDNHGQKDVYVDGGTLNNYPINCFDGWYLSMDTKDGFLVKLKHLDQFPELLSNSNKFESRGPNKTIGFLLFEEQEREVSRYKLESRIGTVEPVKPAVETDLWLAKQKIWAEMDEAQKVHCKVASVVETFLELLEKHNMVDKECITKEELQAAVSDDAFSAKSFEILFGKDSSLDKAFDIIDKDGSGNITFFELMTFAQERGVRMQRRFYGFGRRDVTSFGSYLGAITEAMCANLKYNAYNVDDQNRTCGINTGHVGVLDYTLSQADKDFIVERGYNATMSFLRYYVANDPNGVKKRETPLTLDGHNPEQAHASPPSATTLEEHDH